MKKLLLIGAIIALQPQQLIAATAEWWDTNGATAGAGATPNGTWSTSVANWNTSSAGTNATINWVNNTTSKVRLAAGTDAVNPYTITVSGTVQVVQLGIE